MSDLLARVEAMTPEQREGAIEVLDALTRPLTVREIETFLRKGGVSRSRAIKIAGTVKHWHIVAMMGPEGNNNG
ncbi:hypothetical protein EKJ_07120 [Qipengyuania flava]|jgi:hypothetical protein|uniref:Uncharacterized protein n=1 Tax=Qipengyuania flava TaxID=192812 RepID=A0A3T1CFW6_9SPHN|nr:hypothetical protein [Qipengyuania flava]BBI19865.1 hypothetical protein EKJ_07120 [Qipengyuania flava]